MFLFDLIKIKQFLLSIKSPRYSKRGHGACILFFCHSNNDISNVCLLVLSKLKRLRDQTEDEFSKLTVSNNELKKKIIDHLNRCPPCGTRYAEVAVSSYRRYKKKKTQASN